MTWGHSKLSNLIFRKEYSNDEGVENVEFAEVSVIIREIMSEFFNLKKGQYYRGSFEF